MKFPKTHNCTCVNERVIGSTNSPELVLELPQTQLKHPEVTIIGNFKLKFRRTFDKFDNKKHFSLKTFFFKYIDKESVQE